MRNTNKRTRARRVVHVLCADAAGYRWLKSHIAHVAVETANGFEIIDESKWSEYLFAAGGKEVK